MLLPFHLLHAGKSMGKRKMAWRNHETRLVALIAQEENEEKEEEEETKKKKKRKPRMASGRMRR